jgi:threonine dehydrogenase-like Zn-dependent dehydrogenase
MKAVAVNPARRKVGVVDHPAPALRADAEVRFRMLEVGICGTDREICSFAYGWPPAGFEHMVLGHEGLGVVLEAGAGVADLRPGDLVVPTVRRPCPHAHCAPCRAGRPDFCVTGDFVERGINRVHGFMTEEVVEDRAFLVKVPPALRDIAVLLEPLSVAEKGLEQYWNVQNRFGFGAPAPPNPRDKKCVVLGAGPIGILGAMAFKAEGFDVVCYSRSRKPNHKAELVESFGVPYVSSEEVSPRGLAEQLGRIDVVYEGVGHGHIAYDVMEHLGLNGVVILTGIPPDHDKTHLVKTDRLMRRMVLNNQIVLGTVNAGRNAFENGLRHMEQFIARWPEAVRQIITGRVDLRHAPDLLLGRPRGIKEVLTVSADS